MSADVKVGGEKGESGKVPGNGLEGCGNSKWWKEPLEVSKKNLIGGLEG